MVSKVRSQATKKAWKHRKPLHTCNFCHKGIWTEEAGIVRGGKHYHRQCWDRKEVEKVRHSTAKRGYYKTHGG